MVESWSGFDAEVHADYAPIRDAAGTVSSHMPACLVECKPKPGHESSEAEEVLRKLFDHQTNKPIRSWSVQTRSRSIDYASATLPKTLLREGARLCCGTTADVVGGARLSGLQQGLLLVT
jgi:hypothetical protein